MSNRKIHIANEKNRNALIDYKGFTPQKKVLFVDQEGLPTQSRKYIKSTSKESYDALLKKYEDPEAVAQALINEDVEINMDLVGRFMHQASRVYVNEDNKIVFKINKTEFVYDAKGEIQEEREPRHLDANITLDKPLMWSGKKMPIDKAYNKFVFVRKYQLRHTNGLTYDMLFDIAKELSESKSLMLIGSGKGTGPVIFQDGGNPFRVFLEGRIQGEKYLLIMHLSNLELKPLPTNE